jgi:F420H(2)-dependent quinone reductase
MGKAITKFMMGLFVGLYRATNGGFMGRMAGLNVLLLNTVGRKTGEAHSTLLGYFEDKGDYVIIASNAGSNANPGWFHNLKANPETTIQVKDKAMKVRAEVAELDERNRLWKRLTELTSMYNGYEKSTTRVIPMVRLKAVS